MDDFDSHRFASSGADDAGPETSGADDLGKIAEQLSSIAEQLRSSSSPHSDLSVVNRELGKLVELHETTGLDNATDAVSVRHDFATWARAIYASRRERAAIFGNAELFGEPAWDIMLDLYIAQADGKAVSVSSACIGSASPPTTGLRWLGILCDHGFVMREHDPADQRRVLVRLSQTGLKAMNRYFSSVRRVI